MTIWSTKNYTSLALQFLWNWYTIDACFLAQSWHVRSSGAFAASCIGVIFLVISLEFLRRTQREFDRYLARPYARIGSEAGSGSGQTDTSKRTQFNVARFDLPPWCTTRGTGRLRVWHQAVRSLLYMLQFAVGYFVMLLAMYYNGALCMHGILLDRSLTERPYFFQAISSYASSLAPS